MASFTEDDETNVKSNDWLINFLTANLSPQIGVSVPSNSSINEFRILKYGICGKSNSTFSGRFKERYTFLLPGRIVLGKKGNWNPDSIIRSVDLNREPKYIIYLSPHVIVSIKKNILTLEYPSSSFLVPWRRDRIRKELGAQLLLLKFTSVSVAQEWKDAIVKECQEPKIPLQIINYRKLQYNSQYNLKLHEYVMASALAGNKALLSLVLSHPEASDYINKELHANIRDSFESDPAVFAYALDCMSRDVVDRCLLRFVVLPRLKEEHIKEILDICPKHIKDAVSSLPLGSKNILAPLTILLQSLSDDPQLRKALLSLLDHPAATKARNFERDSSMAQKPQDWSSEFTWFKKVLDSCGDPLRLKTVEEVKLMVKSPLFLFYSLVQSLHTHTRRQKQVSDKEIIEQIPGNYFDKEFEAINENGEVVKTGHFVDYFFKLSKEERSKVLRNLKDRGSVSDDFFRMIVKQGLKIRGGGKAVCDVTKELVFVKREFCEDDFCVSFMEVIPNFGPIIFEELYEARGDLFHSDPDSCKLVVTFVLRLENCSDRSENFRDANVVSITNWISLDPHQTKVRVQKIKCILADLQLEKYVYERLSALMDYFYPPVSVFSLEAPTTEVLRRQLTDGHGASLSRVYTKDRMEDLLIGFMCISATGDSDAFPMLLRMLSPRIFETFLSKDDPFRAKAIHALTQIYNFTPAFLSRMKKNDILNECRHFEAGALDLMTSCHPGDEELFAAVVSTALRLKNYTNLKGRVDALLKNLIVSREKKTGPMRDILDAANRRTPEELGSASLEDFSMCVNDAVNALALLGSNQVNERMRLTKLFDHYLKNLKPEAWREAFRGLYSVAIFMKYLGYEDIHKAYEVFASINRENKKFIVLLDEVRQVYKKPLMTESEVDQVMRAGTSEEAIVSFLESLDKRLQSESKSSEERLIAKLGVEWMRKINDIMKVPIAPRNAQFISMLACCKWARRVCSNLDDKERALVAQVGTGEGKSLIIAMCAIYMVKELGYKVHVLENNEGLLKKDYGQFKDFFAKFGVSVTDASVIGSITDIKDFQIVYTLRQHLESYYREAVFQAIKPFASTVLIVDEVDELIVDDKPNSYYVKAADATEVGAAFEALKTGRGRPANVSPAIWNKAQHAQREARAKKAGEDYRLTASGSVTSLEKGKETRYYNLWAEYIAFEKCNKSPKYQTNFFVQSMPYMLGQYRAILGLSGSLGSPAEKNYLKSTYGAWNYTVPSFLETCRQLRPGIPNKCFPVLDDSCVRIYRNKSEQHRAVVELAIEKASNVPVLIIAKYGEKEKDDLMNECLKALKRKDVKQLGGNPASEFVQLFAQVDSSGENMNWAQIVDKATAGISNTSFRRITITDPFGGRGHDFSVRDDHDHVEDHGGMLVIATFIPESERDWIQWKGRTARSDNRGQYAVILREDPLDESDPAVQKDPTFLTTHRLESYKYKPEVVAALLEVQDKKKEKKIEDDQSDILKGKRLNELCDNYYLTHQTGKKGTWPSCENDKVLCEFLEQGDFGPNKIDEICNKLNLTYTSKFPRM